MQERSHHVPVFIPHAIGIEYVAWYSIGVPAVKRLKRS